jgi:uncharacterized protein YrrD
MKNGIESQVIEEGNLRAVKDTGDFGGPNMWQLFVKDTTGWFRHVQWMDISNIQSFFKTRLPSYNQVGTNKYKKI